MAYSDSILEELWNTSLTYKGMRVNIFGIPKIGNKKRVAFNVALHRLRAKEYVIEKSERYTLTAKGRVYTEKRLARLHTFNTSVKSSRKQLLVLFDIPESRKAEREWFRWHLKKFNYQMVQKSVWVGPAPLPKEFVKYVKDIGLRETVKTFTLANRHTLK